MGLSGGVNASDVKFVLAETPFSSLAKRPRCRQCGLIEAVSGD